MRKIHVVIVLIIILQSHLIAQQNKTSVPIEIKKILDKDYVGWEFPPLFEDWIVKSYQSGNLKPHLISGDFNGDGRKDFALQIIHKVNPPTNQEHSILAFLRRGKSFKKIVLESSPYIPGGVDILLELVKKGSEGEDIELGTIFKYKNDAISVGYSDKASHDYIWKNGNFESVSTGD